MQPKQKRVGQRLSSERSAAMQAAQRNTEPCVKGCGAIPKSKAGKSAHERACTGGAR